MRNQRTEKWQPDSSGDEITGVVSEITARNNAPLIILDTQEGASLISLHERENLANEIGKIKPGMELTIRYQGYSGVLAEHQWHVEKRVTP